MFGNNNDSFFSKNNFPSSATTNFSGSQSLMQFQSGTGIFGNSLSKQADLANSIVRNTQFNNGIDEMKARREANDLAFYASLGAKRF